MSAAPRWMSRSGLGLIAGDGVVLGGDPAEVMVPLSLEELQQLRDISGSTWSLCGLKASDRVLVSTMSEGLFPIATHAEVLAPHCAAVSYAQPRGRLRLLHTIKKFRPSVWVTTACGALDFLARLYMEFNIDPFELGIEQIVLVGEIASPGTHKRLADEFESRVSDLYCEPLFGTALAIRIDGSMLTATPDILGLAETNSTEICEIADYTGPAAELVVRFTGIQAMADVVLRSEQIYDPQEAVNCFHQTIGDQLLVRGRWLSLPLLAAALKLIDGIQAWHLYAERGEGTLDRVSLKVGLNREALVENPMWRSRIREAVASVTGMAVNIDCYLLTADDPQPESRISDQRGHHIGGDAGLDEAGCWQS